jgi:hypothetical protein
VSAAQRYDIAAEGVSWGPTWKKNPGGSWLLPEYSIGMGAIEWAEANLRQPDGPDAGDPWVFTDEQLRMVMWIYAVDGGGVRFLLQRNHHSKDERLGEGPVRGCADCYRTFGSFEVLAF